MLSVGKDLASFTLAAGEPFVFEVQLLDSAGRATDLDDQAMILTFYTAGTREVVTDYAGNRSQYEGDRLSDSTGEYFRWAFDGRWSDAMLNRPGLRVELAQRLLNGRRIITTGTLSVISSAAIVPSLPGGLIALTAVRATIKDNATLGGPPLISQAVIVYDGPSVPVPAPVFTTPTSIASDGTPQVGELLTGIDGVATNAVSYTRRWLLGSTLLTSSATYTPSSAGSYRYETTATGPGGETTSGSNITVAAAAPVLGALTLSPTTATAGTSATLAIIGATAGSVITGTVPAGMTLNSAARTITGTPTTAGSPNIVLTETLAGATGSPRQSTVGVTIAAAPVTPVLGALTVSPSSATVGTAYSGTINGLSSGSSIALSGAGAAGLSIAGAVITGTPTTTGPVNIIETLAGATGSPRTSSGVVTVAAAAPVLGALALSQTTGMVGTAYTGTVSGKTSGSTLTLSGAGAPGLLVSGAMVSGTPTTAGNVNIVETLAGATGSPRTSTSLLTVDSAVTTPGVLQSIGIMTDLDSDVDDVIALALAVNMVEDAGITISYLSVGSRNDYSAHAGRVLLNAANRASVPVCQIQTPTAANSGSNYSIPVANLLQPVKLRAEYPESVAVTRAALAAMPDKSHKIVTMGCLTDYAALLASPADGISPLTGRELVAAKVISVHPMAGTYPNSTAFGPNTNDDFEASNAAARGPVPVYWAIGPLGADVYTSIPSNGIAANDPYNLSMVSFNGKVDGPDRASWDSMPVMHAILGESPYFVKSEPQDVDFTVGTAWTPNPAGNNYYLSKNVSAEVLRDFIDRNVNAFMVNYAKKTAPIAPVTAQSSAQAPNLQAEWPFYETAGRTAVSLTGKHDVTLFGDALLQAFPARLVSLNRNGVSAKAPASTDFGGYAGLFVGVVLFRQLFATCTIMSQDDSTQSTRAWSWRTNGNKMELFWRGGTGVTIVDTTAQIANKWCSVAVLIRPDRSVVFYTNGVAGGGGTLQEGAISPTGQSFLVAGAMKGWMAYGAVHKGEVSDAYVQAQLQRARDVAATKNITLP